MNAHNRELRTVLYTAAIALAILSSMLYHTFIKLTPQGAHPALSLVVTYGLAALLCGGILLVQPLQTGLADALKQLNWASYALALAIVGLEMAYILAYRAGWRISIAAVLVNTTVTVLLVPIGLLAFKEKLSPLNVAGILVAIAGLVMMNVK
jgi:drug/metabolite transporter (DMT)-like permease